MATFLLKLTLVIAVAISQAIGGVSCCCLARAISESLAGFSGVSRCVGGTDSLSKSQPACPKCCARRSCTAPKKNVAVTAKKCSNVCVKNEQQCTCVKLQISSDVPSNPITVVQQIQLTCGLPGTGGPVLGSELPRLPDYKVPFRFGGNFWQSFACVWKN